MYFMYNVYSMLLVWVFEFLLLYILKKLFSFQFYMTLERLTLKWLKGGFLGTQAFVFLCVFYYFRKIPTFFHRYFF